MSGMVGAGLSALSGLMSWAAGRQQARREAAIRKSGQDEVKVAIAEGGIEQQEAARKSKEASDAEVRNTSYDDRVDRL
jgi:hypothetical protein